MYYKNTLDHANKTGIIPVLLLISVISAVAFLAVSSFTPFKDRLFSLLFFKSFSYAQQTSSSQPEIGFNVTGITHYGYNDILPYSQSASVEADLSEIQKMNGAIVRVFVANNKISDTEAANRLDVFLTKAAVYNISAIISFIDFYGSGFNPQGTDQYYTGSYNGIPLLGHTFFDTGYKDRYLSFVKTVVSANKNHSNVYAWEPGNELKDDSSPQTFINFMKDVTNTIKSIDSVHKIATGMLNSAHTALTPGQLYPSLNNIDIITVHTYNGDHGGLADVIWAIANGKKAVIEEIGYSGTGDRSGAMKSELDFWKAQGATAFLQWGFLAQGLADNGNGDRDSGMDTIWHTDYNTLFTLFKSYTFNAAPSCDQSQVQMSISPNPADVGSSVTFNVSGNQGSTYFSDNWSGGVDCSGGFWGSKTCNTVASGNFTWTHSWKNCAPNDCSVTSAQCSRSDSFTTLSPSDIQPPTISSVFMSNITTNSATVTWTTDELATSKIEYGFTANYGNQTTEDVNIMTSHSQNLTNLSASTIYNFRVVSGDQSQNQAISINYSFTTQAEVVSDTTAPAKISNLTASDQTETSANLSWTATGDDNIQGTASKYDTRYSTALITDANWNQAAQVSGLPLPKIASSSESYIVVGLFSSTLYYFAIKVADEVPNWSALSNIAIATTLSPQTSVIDTIAPGFVTNLLAKAGDSQIALSWTNPTDSDFVRTVVVRKENAAPTSPLDGRIVFEGNQTSFVDNNLNNGTTYYYSVFAYDRVLNYSEGATVNALPKADIVSIVQTPPPASTQKPIKDMTVDELLAKIAELLVKANQLKTELAKMTSQPLVPDIPTAYTFIKPLYLGLKNNQDVRYLQTLLKSQGADIYPQGLITGNYGLLTRQAVIKFQIKYKIVLSALSPGAGLVGPKTRMKINEILSR
ncbi:MAG: hypothetical protein Q7S82_02685 [bacterium]|nr:hypothetical protein [bacterium]